MSRAVDPRWLGTPHSRAPNTPIGQNITDQYIPVPQKLVGVDKPKTSFRARLMQGLVKGAANLFYDIKITGKENVPPDTPVVFVANHVTFIDWMILIGALPRPVISFVMYYTYYQIPILRHYLRRAQSVPIAGQKENNKVFEQFFDIIKEKLRTMPVMIFPEGKLSTDGAMDKFRKTGIERILEGSPVDVIPVALNGLWESGFSKRGDKKDYRLWPAFLRPLVRIVSREHRWRPTVLVNIGQPIAPSAATAETLEAAVRQLLETSGTGVSENDQ